MEDRDLWSKVEISVKVISSILIPLLLLHFGTKISTQQFETHLLTESKFKFNQIIIEDLIKLHRDVDQFLFDIEYVIGDETSMKTLSENFLKEFILDISSLQLRLRATRKDSITSEDLETLAHNISQLKTLYQEERDDQSKIVTFMKAITSSSFEPLLEMEFKRSQGLTDTQIRQHFRSMWEE